MIDHSIVLLAFMFLVVAFARYLESRLVFVQKISSAVVCTLLGIFLANVGVPHAIGFTVELIQPHAYSWGYPEDAADVPVERLDWIAATVDDVGTASRRFEKLFGTGAREARIRFGNRCSLHLKRDPAGDTGLDAMCLSMRENGERLSTVTDLGFRLVAGSR